MKSRTRTTPPKQPTLRDWLAMTASEKDVDEIVTDAFEAPADKVVEKTRQQARYEHADRMLKARAENP